MTVIDESAHFIQVWHCEAPEMDESFQVLRDRWEDQESGKPVRHIYEIRRAKKS